MLLSRDDADIHAVDATPAEDADRGTRRARTAGHVAAALVVAAAIAVGWWARAPLLDDSLWWDEIFSAQTYVRGGPAAITDPDLYIANNHLLYTLWTWFAVDWFGETSFAVRFFGLVPAVLAGVVATGWAWRRLGAGVAAAVAVLFATSPLHVEVSTLGRGWGLAMLGVVAMLVLSVELGRLGRAAHGGDDVRVATVWTHLLAYGLAGVVATFTIAPMAIPFTLHAVPLLRWRILRWRVVGLGLIVGAASGLWYAEVLDFVLGKTNRVGTNLGTPLDGLSWAVEGWNRLLRAHLAPFAQGSSVASTEPGAATYGEVAVIVAVAGLVVTALVAWWRAGGVPRLLTAHLVAGYVGTFLVMWAFGANAVDRYVSFLLGHLLLLVAGGAVVVARWLAAALRDRAAAPVGVAVAGALLAGATVLPAAALVDYREETTAAPFEAIEEAAALVAAADADVVITNRTVGFVVFRYYLGDVFEIVPPERIGRRLCREVRFHPDHVIAFLDYPHPVGTPSGSTACIVLRDTERHVLQQRRSSQGITVWISRPRSTADDPGG